jgi:hypothetical protein
LPTLATLERIAASLDVTVRGLLSDCDRGRQEQIAELVRDPFVAEILPFMAQLNQFHRAQLLAKTGSLARHQTAWPN